jgi:hypothetical protein
MLLASKPRKRSKDSVNRAPKELTALSAILVQHRRRVQVNLTNPKAYSKETISCPSPVEVRLRLAPLLDV